MITERNDTSFDAHVLNREEAADAAPRDQLGSIDARATLHFNRVCAKVLVPRRAWKLS